MAPIVRSIARFVSRPRVPARHLGHALSGVMTFPATPLGMTVELALGADLDADPATWAWTDISGYVMARDGMTVTVGRSDEASRVEPSSLAMLVNNSDGRFSRLNPVGAYYGTLHRNTPVRVTVDPGARPAIRAQQYGTEWPPRWDVSGNDNRVPVRAAGILRRLDQGTAAALSALTQTGLYQQLYGLVEYWPCEDAAGSTMAASVTGGTAMSSGGTVTFGAESSLAGSDPLATLGSGGTLVGTVGTYTPTAGVTVTATVLIPSDPAAIVPLLEVQATGTIRRWRLHLDATVSPPRLYTFGYTAAGAMVVNDFLAWDNPLSDDDYGHYVMIELTAAASGADINYATSIRVAGGRTTDTGTVVTQTLGVITGVTVAPGGSASGISVGHVAVYRDVDAAVILSGGTLGLDIGDVSAAMDGLSGETAVDRISRVCTGAGVPMALASVYGDVGDTGITGPTLGAQAHGDLLAVLRSCEAADGGVLAEDGFGLTYQRRACRYNLPVAMTLDYALEQAADITTLDDDQRIRNDWTVARTDGSSARAIDQTSIDAEGRYDDSTTLGLYSDSQLPDQASWRVHLGVSASGELRYTITINLAAHPELIPAWVECGVGSRINVLNPPDDVPPGTIDGIIEGYRETFGTHSWRVVITASPYRPYEVFQIEDRRLGRVDTGGSTLASGVNSSATSLSIATTGQVWTTAAADLPMDINIGGEQITVTAVSGSSSPQTFTVTRSVNGVSKAQSAGAAVNIWKGGAIAL